MTLAIAAPPVNDFPQQLRLFSEHELYHSHDRRGFFALCWRKHQGANLLQNSYPLTDLPYVIANVDRSRDTYLSQAEFYKPNRRVINLLRLGCLWVDLDTYHTEFAGEDPHRTLDRLFWHCDESGIPYPSVVLYSGRGLYAKWIFTNSLPSQALPRWLVVQRELVKHFDAYGADKNAMDASRVLRLEGTVNSKSGEVVRVLYPAKAEAAQVYDFDDLAAELLPYSREEVAAYNQAQRERAQKREERRQEAARLHSIEGGGRTTGLKRFNPLQLNFDRLTDLRALAQLRGWVDGNPDGSRDAFLFAGACFLAWIVAPGQVYREAQALAREWCPTWTQDRINNAVSAVYTRAMQAAKGVQNHYQGKECDPRYIWSNKRLVDFLGITAEEERHTKTIMSGTEAKARHAARDEKRRRDAGAVSRDAYLLSVEQKRTEARLRAAKGESQGEIAAALGVDRTTVYRWLRKA